MLDEPTEKQKDGEDREVERDLRILAEIAVDVFLQSKK